VARQDFRGTPFREAISKQKPTANQQLNHAVQLAPRQIFTELKSAHRRQRRRGINTQI
jgi:hypothetical protein